MIAASASATTVLGIHQVDRISNAFHGDLHLPGLSQADPGKPQTVLLIGSDKRAKGARDHSAGQRSDTMILMRLDASKGAIALMSLPRDLKVRIPGHGTDKLNAAFSYGGPPLLLTVVKRITGLRVNHVINVDFRGFKDAVDQIGCVYTDVDRKYFNDNSNPNDQYATIKIFPGYQKLCGKDALDYVRYRHTDTDIVRAARQQDFLRQAKSQVGTGKLISKQEKLLKVVSKYTSSDIHGRGAVISLLRLAVDLAGSPVVEIHFPARVGASYVTASATAVKKATGQFLNVTGPTQSGAAKRGKPRSHSPRSRKRGRSSSGLNLLDISAAGRQQALLVAKDSRLLKIYYPRLGVPHSSFSVSSPRAYRICGPHGHCWASYRMVIAVNPLLGEYYGLQGTRWKDPPIIKSPSEVRMYHGRKLMIFTDGARVRLVAWQTKGATYWISNTLLQTVSKKDMLAIAGAAKPLS
ncbi:MAG: polyisoprenyl-teichoic acid--peptidoglycan teichoic acid transferase [Thermoleophilaceae bacterium]|jgi:LCP family protein required for cell wall assembly|nr:polyisoprenyl-teichoic acid--peptidoglycan teichoic acid transferase [Thermoleophilaceae bacterium]